MDDISREDIDFYRWVHTNEEGGQRYGEPYSRPSTAKGVSTQYLRYRNPKPAVKIQQLVARVPEDGTVHDAELVWVDYDG